MAASRNYSTVAVGLVALALGAVASVGPTGPAFSSAWAQTQDIFGAAGLVTLLPAGEIIGDGLTPVEMQVLALSSDGSAMLGLKGKVTATGGNVGELSDKGNGLYKFTFTPPQVATTRQVEITIKGKLANGKSVAAQTFSVAVNPPHSHKLSITANPPQVILGQDTASTLTFQLECQPGENLDDVQLEIRSTSGEIQNLTNLGGGTFSALFVPPRVNFPHLAILTVADRKDPSRTYGFVSIPLVGKTNFPVNGVPAGSKVVLRIGDRDFGPVAADASGRVTIPIMVPPGVQKATVVIAADGKTTQRIEDLKVPDAKRIKLFPLHMGVPSDNRLKIPVRVAVATPEGKPSAGAQVQISASAGTVTAPIHEGNGVYRVDFTPPLGAGDQEITLAASLASEPGLQSDKAVLKMIPVRPSALKLESDPKLLPTGSTGFKLLMQATGPDNQALTGRQFVLVANGAKQRGDVKDLKGGDYQVLFDTTGTGPVEVTSTVQTAATGNPVKGLVMFPMADRLLNDGLSSVLVNVVAVDEFGYPVANVPVNLTMLAGDGSVPTNATTNEAGLVQVYYTAGRKPAVVQLQASTGDHQAAIALLQVPDGVTAQVANLPRSATTAGLATVQAWSAIVRTLRIDRESTLGNLMATPPGVTGRAGALKGLTVTSEPAAVAAGGTVVIKVKAEDAEKRGVSGQRLDILPNVGTLGAIQETGNGEYKATLSVPAGLMGDVKVSVVANDGAVTSFLKIPIAAAGTTVVAPVTVPTPEPVSNPWTTAEEPKETPASPVAPPPTATVVPGGTTPTQPETTTVTAPTEPTPPVTPEVTQPPVVTQPEPEKVKPPREKGDHPWFHVRGAAGIAGYNYNYQCMGDCSRSFGVEGDPTPYGEDLEISGEDLAAAGDPSSMRVPTIDAKIDAWLPFFEYVGVGVRYRTTWFGVQTDSWTEPQPGVDPATIDMSWVDHFGTGSLKARYFYDAGPNRFYVAADGGLVMTSFPLVVLRTVDNVRGLWFYGWPFTTIYAGGEVGAELGFGLDARVAYHIGTEAYTGIFAKDLDVELAYAIFDHVTINAGYNGLDRTIVVPNNTESDVWVEMVNGTDSRRGFMLGLGVAF